MAGLTFIRLPKKTYSGKFNIRIPNELHADIVALPQPKAKA
jgi:predicted HicB family RNase H-like nuclease